MMDQTHPQTPQDAQASLVAMQKELEELRQTLALERERNEQYQRLLNHEIRTTLNATLGMSEILLESVPSLDKTHLSYLERIEKSSQSLLLLLDTLIDLERLEKQTIQLDPKLVPLKTVCRYCIRLAQRRTLAADLHFEHNLHTDARQLFADESHFKQLLSTLLQYLILSAPPHSQLGLETRSDPERKEIQIFLWNQDHTPTSKRLERLQTCREPGAWLNHKPKILIFLLAVASHLVELHDADLELHDEDPDKHGLLLTFSAPQPADAEPPVQTSLPAVQTPSPAPPTIPIVFLVEDNLLLLDLLSKYLQIHQYQALCFQTGEEVMQTLEQTTPDLLLLDLHLPDMDGVDIIRHMRSSETLQNIPIVALTGSITVEDKEECIEAGANEFIHKPVRMQELVEVFKRLLSTTPDKEENPS